MTTMPSYVTAWWLVVFAFSTPSPLVQFVLLRCAPLLFMTLGV